ncbi:MAG TPA: hypothetical protein PLY09_00255 [Methanothrix sp.]|nr:hypothetical protein [Methanothrix sp.]HPJ83173.1 hypothetical protein [Methanothrix sp.]
MVLIVLTAITIFAIDRKGSDTAITIVDAWVGIAFICFVFLFLIYLGCMKDGTLSKGELRRAVAGSLTLAFTLLALISMVMEDENGIGKEIVIAYIQLVGIAVGFYFGAKTAERDEEEEKVKLDLKEEGKAPIPSEKKPEETIEE